MPSNTRPPLTSRIRASFEGKRSKSEYSSPPQTAFVLQDPEALRIAIDAAINSDPFQSAIAAHLARLIEPQIKTALDMIQPVVETVYSHEMLLRKTNQSVDNLLHHLEDKAFVPEAPRPLGVDATQDESEKEGEGVRQIPDEDEEDEGQQVVASKDVGGNVVDIEHVQRLLDEQNEKHKAELSQMFASIDKSNNTIAGLVASIAEKNASLPAASADISALKSMSEHSTTSASVMQAQLDQIQADMGNIIEAVGPLGSNFKSLHEKVSAQDQFPISAYGSKLDAISSELAKVKLDPAMMETLLAMSAGLEVLKHNIETGITSGNDNYHALEIQVQSIIPTIEAQTTTLSSLHNLDAHTEVLTAVQKLNAMHESHAAVLDELKSKTISSSAPAVASQDSAADTSPALQTVLEHLSSLDEKLGVGLNSNNDHLTGLHSKIDHVLSSVDNSTKGPDNSADILAAVHKSNDLHASHAAALEEIKSKDVSSAPAPTIGSDTAIDTGTAFQMFNEHLSTLEEGVKSGLVSNSEYFSELSSKIDSVLVSMEAKSPDSSADILAAVQKSNDMHDSHAAVLDELKTRELPVDSSADILAAVQKSNEMHESHAVVLGELKTREAPSALATTPVASAEDTQSSEILHTITAHLSSIDSEIKAGFGTNADHFSDISTKVATLVATVEVIHETDTHEILAAVRQSNDSHVTHAATLNEIKEQRLTPGTETATPSDNGDISELKKHVGDISTALTSHTSTLAAIQAATAQSNDSHASHAESLNEIKERSVGPGVDAAALVPPVDLSAIEEHMTSISSTLSSHKSTLAEIHSATTSTPRSTTDDTASSPQASSTIITILESHTTLLNEIKDSDMSAEILSALHTSNDSHISHANALSEIKDSNMNDEILTELHASNSSHADHVKALTDIQTSSRNFVEKHTTNVLEVSAGVAALAVVIEVCREDIKDVEAAVNFVDTHVMSTKSEVQGLKGSLRNLAAAGNVTGVPIRNDMETLHHTAENENVKTLELAQAHEAIASRIASIDKALKEPELESELKSGDQLTHEESQPEIAETGTGHEELAAVPEPIEEREAEVEHDPVHEPEAPSAVTPIFDAESDNDEPAHEPVLEETKPGEPVVEEPSNVEPVHEELAHEEHAVEEPSHAEPIIEELEEPAVKAHVEPEESKAHDDDIPVEPESKEPEHETMAKSTPEAEPEYSEPNEDAEPISPFPSDTELDFGPGRVPPAVPDPPMRPTGLTHITEAEYETPPGTPGFNSASTSAIASPTSPGFASEAGSKVKKGKKAGKKEKKEKKGKKKPQFFDPDEEEENGAAADGKEVDEVEGADE